MEIRGQDQNDIRSTIPTSYGLVERRREGSGGSNNNNNHHHNGSTTPPPTTTVLTYTQTLDHHHTHVLHRSSSVGSKRAHERYRECLRNHAASVGGNVYDGCGEFMPGGEDGTLEALKCAACDCHRNFHRKETAGDASSHRMRRGNSNSTTPSSAPAMVHSLQLPPISYHHPHHHHPHHHHHQRFPPVVQPVAVAFGGGGNDSGSSEELNVYGHSNNSNAHEHHQFGGINAPPPPPYVLSKKRFRTKFTGEQKDKMMEFAEKIGWRINRQDEGEVDRFCEEVGVRRQVFKVWMHNNKNLRKGGPGAGAGGGASQDEEQDQPLL